MPNTPRTLSECIEAERAEWERMGSAHDLDRARAAADEAVKAVEAFIAAYRELRAAEDIDAEEHVFDDSAHCDGCFGVVAATEKVHAAWADLERPARRDTGTGEKRECSSCGGDLYHYAGCGIGEHGQPIAAQPTPARSEAAGGEGLTEERIRHAIMYDPMAHAAYTLGTTKGRESADRELTSLRQQLAAAREEIEIDNKLLADRDRVLDALPCDAHGRCVPNAMDEIAWMKAELKVWREIGGPERTRTVAAKARADLNDRARTEPAREGEGGGDGR